MGLTLSEMETEIRRMRARYITHTFAGAETVTIPHGLMHIPQKWVIAGIDADARIYGTADAQNLTLTSTAACTVKLEVS